MICMLGGLALAVIFDDENLVSNGAYFEESLPYEIDNSDGKGKLSFFAKHSLMPGQIISVLEENGSVKDKIVIQEIVFKRRATIEIALKNGKREEGQIASQDDLKLGLEWKKLKQPITLSQGRSNQNISLGDVKWIRSDQRVFFDAPVSYDLEDFTLSFYQSKNPKELNNEIIDRIKWEESNFEDNDTIYDLFTPPVIYLVDGSLTTSLPEDPIPESAEQEPFGMELTRFSNEAYPYRLVSWIGETPYFEDTMVKRSPTSSENVRNRLEVGIPYKKFIERKPGQPSLIQTTEEDDEKQLTIEKFVVQQYRDKTTGGLKTIGRALVKDHKLGGDPFEINNQMTEVFAGNVKIEVRLTLENLEGKTFSFTTEDEGISFDFGDRVFSVVKIDELEKNILVRKKGPGQDEQTDKLLKLP